ncbi:MAG: SRPBCC family protein [Steroidobacteraceae bacterium]
MSRSSIIREIALPVAIWLTGVVPAAAGVTDVGSNGFTVQVTAHISAPPQKVYAALVVPARWWSPDHTFSGKASNLHLEAKAGGCWCETLPDGGSVLHLTVVYVDPGKALRLRGALGPFQSYGVDGALTWALKPASEGTDLSVTYTLGGYIKDGFEQLSKAADGVLSSQVARLKAAVETGSPDTRS